MTELMGVRRDMAAQKNQQIVKIMYLTLCTTFHHLEIANINSFYLQIMHLQCK